MTYDQIQAAFIARRTLHYRPCHWTCVALLATEKIARHHKLIARLWPGPDGGPLTVNWRVPQYMSTVRHKLKPYGINVQNVPREGYFIKEDERKTLIALIEDLERDGK